MDPSTVVVHAGRPARVPDAPLGESPVFSSTYIAGGDRGYGRFDNDAWAALEKDPDRFAAVVTDLTMPGMTGIELTERISKLQPNLPVVVATGFLDGDSAAAIARLHVDQVVNKPYGYAALTAAVASALESRRP